MEFKCKSCGGTLSFQEGQLIAKCESCGNSQFVFDFLDKKSEYYQENIRKIEAEQKRFEKLYYEYADDILNAESYCLTSSRLKEIIAFFSKANNYKDSATYLDLAKAEFVRHVESYSDCLLAMKYIENIPPSDDLNKEELNDALTKLAASFRYRELIDAGLAVSDNKTLSGENLLAIIRELIQVENTDTSKLDDLDRELVRISKNNALKWLEENGIEIVRTIDSNNLLLQIRPCVFELGNKYPYTKSNECLKEIDSRLRVLELRESERIREITNENQKAQNRKTIIRILSILTAILLVVAVAVFTIIKGNGYSADNVSMEIVSKINDEYNETLADGYIGAGYYYTFGFVVSNNSPNDIKLIRGTMEVFDSQGNSLSTSSVEMSGKIKAKSSASWNIQLNVSKGDNARKIWNSSLDELRITFKIKTIYFSDGTNKSYGDTKSVVISDILQ